MAPEVTISVVDLASFGQTHTALELAGLGSRRPTIEILWDNYCALDPARLAEHLAQLGDRTLIHIMWSRFLELDDAELAVYLGHLAGHVRALRPVAVSDHLCCFRFDSYYVSSAQEYTYDQIDRVASRIAQYQDAIGMQLLVENNASLEYPAANQIEFLHTLIERTGCGVLFDISNAVVGELNGQGNVASWLPLIAGRALRCHVGSYRQDEHVDRVIDSHDGDVSSATAAAIRTVSDACDIQSITYERDFNRDAAAMARDLVRIQESLCP